MSVADASLPVAAAISLAAGAVSFASPCVLPLVPGYLAFVGGLAGAQAGAGPTTPGAGPAGAQAGAGTTTSRAGTAPVAVLAPVRSTVLPGAALFVAGFATFFTLIGGAFGGLGLAVADHRALVQRVGGVLVASFGLFLLGVWQPAVLSGDTRAFGAVRRTGLRAAFPLGVVFAAGWTPCLGPTLASILTLSASGPHSNPTRGAVLALVYALGLGVPFLAVAAGADRGLRAVAALRRHSRTVERAGGLLLLGLGVLLLTGLYADLLAALRPFLARADVPL